MRARKIRAAALAVTVLVVSGGAARAGTPAGYSVVKEQTLAPGLEYLHLKSDSPQKVHIAHLSPSTGARLKVVESGNRISQSRSALERPDALCRRVDCQVAINGDFITKKGQPYGAVVSAGVMMRSPAPGRARDRCARDEALRASGRSRPRAAACGWAA